MTAQLLLNVEECITKEGMNERAIYVVDVRLWVRLRGRAQLKPLNHSRQMTKYVSLAGYGCS